MTVYDIQIGDYFITYKDIVSYRCGDINTILSNVKFRIIYHYYYNNSLYLRFLDEYGDVFEVDLTDDNDFKIISSKNEQRIKKIKSIFA